MVNGNSLIMGVNMTAKEELENWSYNIQCIAYKASMTSEDIKRMNICLSELMCAFPIIKPDQTIIQKIINWIKTLKKRLFK